MPHYIWKRNGKNVAYDHSSAPRPAPAIEITDEEAKALGFYSPPAPAAEPAPEPTAEQLLSVLLGEVSGNE